MQVSWCNQNLFFKVVSLLWIIPISFYQGCSNSMVLVVGAHFVGTPFAVFAAKLFNRRVIFRSTLLGDDDPKSLVFDNSIRGRFRRIVLDYCDVFFAINQAFVKQYSDLYGSSKPVVRASQGIDVCRFNNTLRTAKENSDTTTLNIISVGFLIRRKGYLDIFDALSKLTIPFRYVVVSSRKLPNSFSHYDEMESVVDIGKEKLKGNIIFVESVENIEELYGDADVLLHNSSIEGNPNVVMEAMACGVVPIIRELDGFKDFLIRHGETGFFYTDLGDALNYIGHLYNDPVLMKRMASNTAKFARENFSFERTWKEILNALNHA